MAGPSNSQLTIRDRGDKIVYSQGGKTIKQYAPEILPPPFFGTFNPEVRNMVYREGFVYSGPIYYPQMGNPYSWKNTEQADEFSSVEEWYPDQFEVYPKALRRMLNIPKDYVQFFRVSKLACQEAASMFYGDNEFKFYSLGCFEHFARNLGSMKPFVRKLDLSWSGKIVKPPDSAKLMCQLTNLVDLKLDIQHFYTFKKEWDTSHPLKIYGLTDLLNLRGIRKLEITYPDGRNVVDNGKLREGDPLQIGIFLSNMEVVKLPKGVGFKKSRYQKPPYRSLAKRLASGVAEVLTKEERKELNMRLRHECECEDGSRKSFHSKRQNHR